MLSVRRHILLAVLMLTACVAFACTSSEPADVPPDGNEKGASGENPGTGKSGEKPAGYQPPPPTDLSNLEISGADFSFMNDVFYFFGADRPPYRALQEIRDVHDLKDWSYNPKFPDAAQQTCDAIADLRRSDYTSFDDTSMVVAILSTMVSRDRSALVRDDCIATLGWFRSWIHPMLLDVGESVNSTEEEVLAALKVLDALPLESATPLSASDRLVCLDAIAVLGNHRWDAVVSSDPIVYRTKMSRPRGIIRRLTGRDLKNVETDPEIRDTLDRALIRVTDQTIFLSLVAGLSDTAGHVRSEASRQLRIAGDARALGPLLHTLESDEDESVRLALISAIAEVAVLDDEGKAAAIPGLAGALNDSSTSVQWAAARALLRVSGENPGPDPVDWRRWWRGKTAPPVTR